MRTHTDTHMQMDRTLFDRQNWYLIMKQKDDKMKYSMEIMRFFFRPGFTFPICHFTFHFTFPFPPTLCLCRSVYLSYEIRNGWSNFPFCYRADAGENWNDFVHMTCVLLKWTMRAIYAVVSELKVMIHNVFVFSPFFRSVFV